MVVNGGLDILRKFDIVETDHGNIIGHDQIARAQHFDRTDRHRVAGGKNRGEFMLCCRATIARHARRTAVKNRRAQPSFYRRAGCPAAFKRIAITAAVDPSIAAYPIGPLI